MIVQRDFIFLRAYMHPPLSNGRMSDNNRVITTSLIQDFLM